MSARSLLLFLALLLLAHPAVSQTPAPPAPAATITSNIHNAPGWLHGHSYTAATAPATRVLNGPGWNEAAGAYVPGQPLQAYQLVSPGACTSGAAGGPTGAGASITDGTCTWKSLSSVDYISITGWAFDSKPWQSGPYKFHEYITADAPLRAYMLDNDECVSKTAPTGTGRSNIVVTPDGCQWRYWADITYSSRKSFMPAQVFRKGVGAAAYNLKANHRAELWNDREYVAGANGELAPLRVQAHFDYTDDVNAGEGFGTIACPGACFHIILTTAPGESFRDRLKPTDPLTGYDPAKGVALHNSTTSYWTSTGFQPRDNFIDLIGLQIKSDYSSAIDGANAHGNNTTVRDSILEGGGTEPTLILDSGPCVVANSLVVSHAPVGVWSKYPITILHSTVVNPDRVAGSVGIASFEQWYFDDTIIANTAVFGFTHAVAHANGQPVFWSKKSAHNATDAPATDAGLFAVHFNDFKFEADAMPGAKYGVAMDAAFVAPGQDWRLAPRSPLRGAGGPFGPFIGNCGKDIARCGWATPYNFDSPDIIGTPRPPTGPFDIGAWQ